MPNRSTIQRPPRALREGCRSRMPRAGRAGLPAGRLVQSEVNPAPARANPWNRRLQRVQPVAASLTITHESAAPEPPREKPSETGGLALRRAASLDILDARRPAMVQILG